MELKNLADILADQPSFRLKQIKQLIFKDLIADWSLATTLPKDLREQLKQNFDLTINAELNFSGQNQTSKALVTFNDESKIETVLMSHADNRHTICVSCQVGCPMGCAFCATGKLGLKRNLTSWEIVLQVLLFARYLKEKEQKVTNVVFMGMGEPMNNFANVIEAIETLHDPDGFNLGARHFSISTCGLIPGIEKLSNYSLEVNLAISLHAPNNQLRSELMPVNNAFPLEKLLAAVDSYIKKTNRKVMFEYLLIDGVNDTIENAKELAVLMKKPLYFVNLIVYNPTGNFKPSSSGRVKKFKEILEKSGVDVTQRYSFGQDIKAACGQLAGKQ
ncbi:MAG: 23S rRNA (adenine(2503)-C(2))-methyltransferase RlmN [Candidatus Buchananbacteria bacterium]|nr:23S rRNA (adenine(2503)-C(2))-methyltransferase RlmN [Candidatus Buchananbacteria bacterium]